MEFMCFHKIQSHQNIIGYVGKENQMIEFIVFKLDFSFMIPCYSQNMESLPAIRRISLD